MDRMIAKFSRFGGREYHVGQDCAELDPDFDSDSDEIKPDIQKPPLVAEFSCHQFTGGIDYLGSNIFIMERSEYHPWISRSEI